MPDFLEDEKKKNNQHNFNSTQQTLFTRREARNLLSSNKNRGRGTKKIFVLVLVVFQHVPFFVWVFERSPARVSITDRHDKLSLEC